MRVYRMNSCDCRWNFCRRSKSSRRVDSRTLQPERRWNYRNTLLDLTLRYRDIFFFCTSISIFTSRCYITLNYVSSAVCWFLCITLAWLRCWGTFHNTVNEWFQCSFDTKIDLMTQTDVYLTSFCYIFSRLIKMHLFQALSSSDLKTQVICKV